MPSLPQVILHKHKADAVKRFHPWIFSGAIKQADPDLKDGDVVEVYSQDGEYLAIGHFSRGSIAVKLFSFQPIPDVSAFFDQKLRQAYDLRRQLGLTDSDRTTCYRLVNAEGDGFPGLIIDWYNGTAVLQAHARGMYALRSLWVELLQKIYGDRLQSVYDKSGAVMHEPEMMNPLLYGDRLNGLVRESDYNFYVDWQEGQKTGFFIDQREHRQLLAQYIRQQSTPPAKVLNTFCYSGGFSIYALHAGAQLVHSVDSSAKAIAWTEQNVALNPNFTGTHQSVVADTFDFLKSCPDQDYDLIILDPPAFAKSLSARHQAVMAYKRLNQMAIAKLRTGGLLFTFSCSQVVGPDYFQGAVVAGAIAAGRPTRLLNHLSQPADHPVSLYHPEGLYLKGLVLQVQ